MGARSLDDFLAVRGDFFDVHTLAADAMNAMCLCRDSHETRPAARDLEPSSTTLVGAFGTRLVRTRRRPNMPPPLSQQASAND
jgi:hypothetical protein